MHDLEGGEERNLKPTSSAPVTLVELINDDRILVTADDDGVVVLRPWRDEDYVVVPYEIDDAVEEIPLTEASAAEPSPAASIAAELDYELPEFLRERQLCSDGACVGIIGQDGRCGECGRLPDPE